MTKKDNELAIVKGAIPSSLKLRFKVLCVQQRLKMSSVIEDIIRKWIQAGAPVPDSFPNFSEENLEDVKGYIPKSLKSQFKNLCIWKGVMMRSILYNLINQWVESANSSD